MTSNWKFFDAPNTACYATLAVLNHAPILRVCHDYDGDWQFHGAQDQTLLEEAKLVCLRTIIELDHSLNNLCDLPYGWCAERSDPSAKWVCAKNHPYPTFSEDGYYLEDAVWLSEYLSDITPPREQLRRSVPPGTYVKLVFRFADELSARADNQCERIWVHVASRDDDTEDYTGTIANDPHHAGLKFDDEIAFHPVHIAAIARHE